MKKKYKKQNVCGVKVTVPIKKWETPMKERSPRASVFADNKHPSRARLKREIRSLVY